MDNKKIEKLKSKRLKLQEEVRFKDLRKRVSSQISHLDKLGESYFVFYESENLNWIESNVQVRKRDGYRGVHGDFQIDVNDSNVISLLSLSEEEINSDKFKEQFSSLISNVTTLIICHQGGDPEIEISAQAFLDSPNEFFSSPETWILTSDKKWIIEYIWDQCVIRFIQLVESTPILVRKLIIN